MFTRLLVLGILTVTCLPASAETHSNRSGTFSFTTPDGWESAGEGDGFSLISPDADAILTEFDLKQQSATETLQETNERVTVFHHRTLGGTPGTPKAVKGNGWSGILQSQDTRTGGYELQLVAKADSKVFVFYLAAPIPGLRPDERTLEEIILSLSLGGRK